MPFKLPILATLLIAVGLAPGCSVTSSPEELEKEAQAQEARSRRCYVPPDPAELADNLFSLINAERQAAGLPVINRSDVLDRIASDYACRMISQGFFDHTDPQTEEGPGQRAMAAGYRFYQVGENLALGQRSAEEAMAWLMASDAHRAVILGPEWVEGGVGVRVGGAYSFYWVQMFGDPVPQNRETTLARQ